MSLAVSKESIKNVGLVYGLFSLVLAIGLIITMADNSYSVKHIQEVLHPGYESSSEAYQIQVSPSQAFAESWNFARVLGLLLWIGIGAFMLAIANDIIGKKEGTFGYWVSKHVTLSVAVLMLISVTLIIDSHSGLFTSPQSTKVVSKDRYEMIKDNKDSLHKLFEVEYNK